MINLFDYATKELDNDAFFCWLFSWLKPEYRQLDMHRHAKNFLIGLTPDNIQNEIQDIQKVEIKKQYKNIDFIVIINDELIYTFEDKIYTREHDNQLEKYKEFIAKVFPDYTPVYVYLKTNLVWPEEIELVSAKHFLVLDISVKLSKKKLIDVRTTAL